MDDDRLTAEDFARLAALPEDHPERRRWATSPEFEARMRLWREFEAPSGASLPGGAAATRELERRMQPTVRGEAATLGGTPASAISRATAKRSWLRSLFDRPPRAALAFATIVVVAIASTWLLGHEQTPPAVRGGPERAAFELMPPQASSQGLELSWSAVPGADGYRVVFYGADMAEIGRIDRVRETHVQLRSGALPQGLAPGKEVLAEVTALSGDDPIATTKPRLVTPR